MRILLLFWTFFKIGLFSFGGGYGMLPLMEQETIGRGWLDESQFMNFVAVSESTPGPIAINMATFVGTSQAGFWGAVACTLGAMMPSIIIILLIVTVFKKFLEYNGVKAAMLGMKPVIVGLIFSTGIFLGLECVLPNITQKSFAGFDYISLLMILGLGTLTFVYKKLRKKNISAIILIIMAAVLGILLF